MQFLKSTVSLAGAAAIAIAFSVSFAPTQAQAAPAPTKTAGGVVIWKKGKPSACGAYFYWNKKRKMCHDARWK